MMGKTQPRRARRSDPVFDQELGIWLQPIYCINCGGFIGVQNIQKGVAKIYCRQCKDWTTLVGHSGYDLTEVNREANIR